MIKKVSEQFSVLLLGNFDEGEQGSREAGN
jgi:hypothetical protein